jgi:hypothetical protein
MVCYEGVPETAPYSFIHRTIVIRYLDEEIGASEGNKHTNAQQLPQLA